MTKNEALQLFASHVDIPALKADFPDLDYVVTELEDGQQEIIIRLQGEDADFRPASDIAAIEAIVMKDLPDGVKNSIVLRKHKRKLILARKRRRDIAILKRIKAIITPAGISLGDIVKTVQQHLPVQEVEL